MGAGLIARATDRYRQVARMNLRPKGWRAYANLAHGYYEYLRGHSTLASRPVKLIFDPTNACQLACPLCPTGVGLIDRGRGHADIELFRRLMDELGDYLFFVDLYNWGEPLLNPRLEDFIAIAHAHRISTFVSTNLSLRLTDERIHRLLTSGVSEIGVCLDGATDATNGLYRRKGNFDLVVENMRRLVAARRTLGQSHPLISWLFIVFRFNEHEIDAARKLAADIGVDRFVPRPPFLDAERYGLPESEARAVVRWVPSDPKYRIHVSKPPERRRCGWHYTAAAVNFDGTVTPCSTAFRKADDFGTFGRSGEHGWFGVLNNPAFRAARDFMAGRVRPAAGVICERCPTPTIRNYHRVVYRQIGIITSVVLAERLRAGWRDTVRALSEPRRRVAR